MLATFIIGLREGLEAALIVGIIAAFLRRNGRSLTPMLIGVGAAVLLSLAVGIGLKLVEQSLPQAAQEGMEAIIGVVAGAVQGYFLTRLSYTVEPVKAAALTIPLPDLVTDALYSALVGEKLIDFPHMEKFDLETFKTHIRDKLNERLGEEVFHDVIVEQIDFLSKADIRSNMRRGSFTMKKGEKVVEGEAAPAEAAPSH